jgi:hypothetical protein
VEDPSAQIHRPPRRGDKNSNEQLTESACLDLLRGVEVGRLAVHLEDGGIDIFPVNFVVDGGCILLRTSAGTKLDSVKREPTVAFEADHFDYFERTAWSVVVKGYAVVVTDHDELFGLLNVDLSTWQGDRKPFFVRIRPSSITGRQFEIHRAAES